MFSDSALCSVRDVGDAFDLAPASEVSRDCTGRRGESSQHQDRRGQVAAAVLGAVPLHPVAGRGLWGIGQELAWKLSEGEFLPDKSKILVMIRNVRRQLNLSCRLLATLLKCCLLAFESRRGSTVISKNQTTHAKRLQQVKQIILQNSAREVTLTSRTQR